MYAQYGGAEQNEAKIIADAWTIFDKTEFFFGACFDIITEAFECFFGDADN